MKSAFIMGLFLTLVFGASSQPAQAQQPKGYYITLNNDTISTCFKLNKGYFSQYFSAGHNLYETLPVINDNNKTIKFKPDDIKGFYIEWDGEEGLFTSMAVENEKKKFWQIMALTPRLSVYVYFVGEGIPKFFMQRADGQSLMIGNEYNHVRARKALQAFFVGDEYYDAAIKKLFVQPGHIFRDMRIFLKRYFKAYEQEMLFDDLQMKLGS